MSTQIHLSVEGMTCGHCQAAVERSISAIPGVEHVEVDLEGGAAHATVNADVATELLVAAVQTAGYTARAADQA